jgi:hypothetical protein
MVKCKKCGCDEFTRSFEGYDILTFDEDGNEEIQSNSTNESDDIRCRECGILINYDALDDYEKLIGEIVRFEYKNKTIKGYVKEVNDIFVVLETKKEYFIAKKDIISKQVCK